MIDKKGLAAVKGFKFSGTALAGNKKNMGLLYSTVENTIGTAVYTRNDVTAAPVIISKKMDNESSHKRAILINSGTANAFTGKQGLIDAENCVIKLSQCLNISPCECYIGSTGVIGKKLDMDSIISNIEHAVKGLEYGSEKDFIEATMTTDTRIKQASVTFELDGVQANIAACAKGAGMIMPNMATMLCSMITDVSISHEMMSKALRDAVEDTFNCISVDGDTSTNDSIFFLSNGLAGNKRIENADSENYKLFYLNLQELMEHMAKEIVNDGEGVTKFITIDILNTPDRDKAKAVAISIANSPLVKTALFGEDLNWGRIMMAVGKAMTKMDCSIIDVTINDFEIVKSGEAVISQEDYLKARQSLKNRNIDIAIDFKQGTEKIRVWTCDFSYDYVKINAHYTT
ncbi:MAG TPA: bifunctional glutamate N-acetyltransferase/amino-acid acetyltransferase ArgJ [Clostridia bacterium]|nr:bifunctional glutamate N-acetyltransferase/amino-acid acetyltransferase ArgJ [Clostridia bacterium]